MLRTLSLALILAACTPSAPVVTPTLSSPPPTQAVISPSPSSTPGEVAATPTLIPPSARPIPAGAAPFELLTLRWADVARLWLIDPELRRTPELIAKWSPAFEVGTTASVTADRSLVVISAVTTSGAAGLFLIDTRSGTVRPFLADSSADLLAPVVDPRGLTVAYTRRNRGTADPGTDGIWTLSIDGRAPHRLVGALQGSPQALRWSADGAWLAYTPVGFPHVAIRQPIHVISADGARRIDTGLDGGTDWHPTASRLLITQSVSPGGDGTSVVSSYDVPSGRVTTLYRPAVPGTWLARARWRGDGTRFVVLEGQQVGGETEVVVVQIGGLVERPAKAAFVVDAYWSATGALMLTIGGDDSAVGIHNATSGRSIQLCLRTDDPVRCV